MVSSEDDFLLLLRKWRNESMIVSTLGNIGGHLHLCLSGTIAHIDDEEKSFSVVSGNSFALVDYGDCQFGYSAIEHSVEELTTFARTFGFKYEEAVILTTPSKAHIILTTQLGSVG
jgi:hypothetical protein